MVSLHHPDQMRGDHNQKQRYAEPDQEGAGEEQPHQMRRTWLGILGGAANQNLQAGIQDRLGEIEPAFAFGSDRNSSNAEISPTVPHGIQHLSHVGHDKIFRLAI
jgi:hypothetical protein